MKNVFIVEYCGLGDVSYPVGVFDTEGEANDFIFRTKDGPSSEIHHYEIVEATYYEDY